MPDPINALQNLASQGTRNNSQMMNMPGPQSGQMGPQQMPSIAASNLLQTLNRGPVQGMNHLQVRLKNKLKCRQKNIQQFILVKNVY